MATVSTFTDMLETSMRDLAKEHYKHTPGTFVRVDDPASCYQRNYTFKQYGKSIKISQEMMEDKMASIGYGDYDYSRMEAEQRARYKMEDQMKRMEQKIDQQQQLQAAPMYHSHSLGALGGAASSGFSTTSATDTTGWITSTDGSNTLAVNADGGLQLDQAQLDETVERKLREDVFGKKKKTQRTNRLTKWFRLNQEMTSDGIPGSEPLDDLRKEMAEWLEGV